MAHTALTQEVLLKTRVAVDRVRLSRLATQNAIERSREFLAETRAALVSLRDAHHHRLHRRLRQKVQRRIDALGLRQMS